MEIAVSELTLPTTADVLAAEAVIRPHIRRTPVIEVPAGEFGLAGVPIVLKLEFMQASGSFKARGAFANLLMREGTKAGVVAASGGNHGAAVAYAAMKLGVPAHIFVPEIASPAKIARIRSYGAEIHIVGEVYNEALEASQRLATERGLVQIHAYDQFETLCGQGTVAAEWREQSPEIDTVLVAVGGGGLIGGMAAYNGDNCRIIGVEPELAPTLGRALEAGEPVDVAVSGVAADSLGARRIGRLAFPLARKYVEAVKLVSDAEILVAQRALWDVLRVVVEPGGAASMAALLSGKYVPRPDEHVGVLLCGANTTAVNFD
jgi:threonine dehydratase